MGDSVALKIDGNEVKALFGQTIFEAARAAGIEIPHLCYHDRLPATGACRMCAVEAVRAGQKLDEKAPETEERYRPKVRHRAAA
jgi:NADH dehydrogenase/NADH:ubiquinone oxidoreductase subunit G